MKKKRGKVASCISGLKFAFSLYSAIPIPKVHWEEEDSSLTMCFFPGVGVVIGSGIYALFFLSQWLTQAGFRLHSITYGILMIVFPVFLTGGIHMDGFLDTEDALHSHLGKEERLRILKDVHTGAFALIAASVYFLLSLGAYMNLSEKNLVSICLVFPVSRMMTGLLLFLLPQARTSGMLKNLMEGWNKKSSLWVLGIGLFLSVVLLLGQGRGGIGVLFGAVAALVHFRYLVVKKFGGITGDLCGYFLQVSELCMALGGILGSMK